MTQDKGTKKRERPPLWNIFEWIFYWFPARQIYHRSDGAVRYFSISTGTQLTILTIVFLVSIWFFFSTISLVFGEIRIRSLREELSHSELVSGNFEIDTSVDPGAFEEGSVEEAILYLESYAASLRRQIVDQTHRVQELREEAARLDVANATSAEQAEAILELLRIEQEQRADQDTLKNMLFTFLGVIGSFVVGLVFFVAQRVERPMRKNNQDSHSD